MQDKDELFGQLVENAREKKHLTREALAEEVGIGVRHLFAIEREKKNPSFPLLKKIVYALDIPPDSVFSPDMPSDDSLYVTTTRAIGRLNERELTITKDVVDSLLRNRENK